MTSEMNEIAAHLALMHGGPVLRVAIDGVGKTTFADNLARLLRELGRQVIRASADGFLNPRAVRRRLGRGSPEGFYRNSYDYDALCVNLLEPLSPGGTRRYRTAIFDHFADAAAPCAWAEADTDSILVFDGLFLHRPELSGYWDFSIFLEAPFEVTLPRGAARGKGFDRSSGVMNQRYVEGEKLYFKEAEPQRRATVLLDYTDFSHPSVLRWDR
ncbi:MAG: hypothetical protein ACRED9_13170 [Caulobacteraceae bacterium]